MNIKNIFHKWYALKNLPLTQELRNISRSLDVIQKSLVCQLEEGISPFQSSKVDDGLEFIGRSTDRCIVPWMRENSKTWAKENMDLFIEIAAKYSSNIEEGIFIDIGANIGTTCIYVISKYKRFKAIAFEPDLNNYRVLRSNCILNDVDNLITCENVALSNKVGKQPFLYDEMNPGQSQLICTQIDISNDIKEVEVTRLDDYIISNKIPVNKIQMIWIDTEGFEPEVIEGALDLLKERPVPLFAEVNSGEYRKKGKFNSYIKNMCQLYSHFIDVREAISNGVKLIPTSELEQYIVKLESDFVPQTDFIYVNINTRNGNE